MTINTRSASKALGNKLSGKYAKNATTTSGFVSTVTNDSTGRPKTAIVQIVGGTAIAVSIPYGSNIYPGISVALVNDGSPSLASWRIANSSSASPVLVGGQIINQNGSTIANFDAIWVKDRGYIMAGGFEDILGQPTGPRVIINEYGMFGYAVPFPEPVVSIATIEADDLHVGDVLIGYKRPSHANFLVSPEQGLIRFSVNDTPFLTINGETGNRLEDYLWIGPSSGPQVGMGEMLGVAEIAMRDLANRYVFLVRSDPMRVQIGATTDEQKIIWDNGVLDVTGTVQVGSSGALIWAGGKGVADSTGISHTEDASTFWRLKPTASVFMEINSSGPANYNALRVEENYGIGGYFKGGYIGVYGKSTTDEIGIMGYSANEAAPPGSSPPSEDSVDLTDGIEAINPGVSVYGLTQGGTAGRFVAQSSPAGTGGRGLVAKSDDNSNAAATMWNTGTGPALVAQGITRLGDGGTTNYVEVNTAGALTVHGTAVIIHTEKTPASATATGTKGEICFDSSFLYVAIASNTWKRVAIATW